MSHDDDPLEKFDGRVRLFPLPEVVLLPHVVQPLHVFEPRYRELLQAAVDGDGLITMAVLLPGWEDAEEPKAIHRHVCVGQVVSHTPLPDGRSNILLLGRQRATIRRELPQRERFREAEAELLDELYPADGDARRGALQQLLLETFRRLLPQPPGAMQQQLEKLLTGSGTLGMLTDVIASMTDLPAKMKLQLLADTNVDQRAACLLDALQGGGGAGGTAFPPDFSDN